MLHVAGRELARGRAQDVLARERRLRTRTSAITSCS